MKQYTDVYGKRIIFQYGENHFDCPAKHVLVLSEFRGQWLLTQHAERGLEFPGGKVEPGETIEVAAKRELYEETGAKVQDIALIGHYYVEGTDTQFVKAVFAADVSVIEKKEDYLETAGPFLIKKEQFHSLSKDKLSFLMKDGLVFELMDSVGKKVGRKESQ